MKVTGLSFAKFVYADQFYVKKKQNSTGNTMKIG